MLEVGSSDSVRLCFLNASVFTLLSPWDCECLTDKDHIFVLQNMLHGTNPKAQHVIEACYPKDLFSDGGLQKASHLVGARDNLSQ